MAGVHASQGRKGGRTEGRGTGGLEVENGGAKETEEIRLC